MAKGKSKFLETRNFGFVIGLLVFAVFCWLSFGPKMIEDIERSLLLDIYFNRKGVFVGEKTQEGVTQKKINPYINRDILIVGIDAKSLQQFGKWPFPRSVEADFVNTFTRIRDQSQRERAIFLDLAFIEPDVKAPENDALLLESIDANGRVILDTFLQPGEIGGSLAEEYFSRQLELISRYGELTGVEGDTSKLLTSLSVESPLKPYARATKGYGSASYIADVDNTFRRQPLIARLAELKEEIRFSDLNESFELNEGNFERLVWIDKNSFHHDVTYPLTDDVLSRLKTVLEKRAPALLEDTDGDGEPDKEFIIRKYKDHFVPSITLSLVLEYMGKSVKDVKVVLGEHILIPNPMSFNTKTSQWEPNQQPRAGRLQIVLEILSPFH